MEDKKMFSMGCFGRDKISDGMVVQFRDDSYAIFYGGVFYNILNNVECKLSDYTYDLYNTKNTRLDIINVYRSMNWRKYFVGSDDPWKDSKDSLWWTRTKKGTRKISIPEIERELGCKVEFINKPAEHV